jgi:hypothetical protein
MTEALFGHGTLLVSGVMPVVTGWVFPGRLRAG